MQMQMQESIQLRLPVRESRGSGYLRGQRRHFAPPHACHWHCDKSSTIGLHRPLCCPQSFSVLATILL